MRIVCLKPFLMLVALLFVVAGLSSCSSTSVYGSVGISASSGNFNQHSGSSRRMRGSISVGGRIR